MPKTNFIRFFNKDNDKGMWHSTLISNQLIDHYIPFLPLQVEDVENCIKNEFKKYKTCEMNFVEEQKYVQDILKELVYEENNDKLFSKYGCKRITSLVRKLLIERKLEFKLEF